MANELTKASLDGNSTKVPIGAPVITNNKALNSKAIQGIMTGASITKPSIDTIEALGFDGKQITRDTKTNSFGYVEPEEVNVEKSVQWSFDSDSGSLVFVRSNGSVFTISGFLRQEDFGVGPTGPRGDPGRDGRNGRDGIDGKDGPTGCSGTTGLEGRRGDEGEFGEEGPVGPTGLVGPVGPTGPSGVQGPEGLPGLEGRRGLKGFSCPTTLRGPDGPEGRKMNEFVGLGNAPMPTDLIWAAPEDCLCYFDPSRPDYVGFPKKKLLRQQIRQAPPLVCPPGQTVGGVYGGPTSSAGGTYYEYIYSDGTVETSATDYKGAFCAVPPKQIVKQETLIAPTLTCPSGQTINGVWEGATSITGTYTKTTWSDGSVETSAYDYNGAYCAPPVEPPFEWQIGSATSTTGIRYTARRTYEEDKSTKKITNIRVTFSLDDLGSHYGNDVLLYTEAAPLYSKDGTLKMWFGEAYGGATTDSGEWDTTWDKRTDFYAFVSKKVYL